jgi:hypothetical protein
VNLIEALKTGRALRRTDKPGRPHIAPGNPHYSKEEILADDWEVEEEKINITCTELTLAMQSLFGHGLTALCSGDIFNELKRRKERNT